MSLKQQFQQETSTLLGIQQLQRTFDLGYSLYCPNNCQCRLCRLTVEQKSHVQLLQNTDDADKWLYTILKGLTPICIKTLKLYIPDTCFPGQDGIQIYRTNKKDFRVQKVPGTTPDKSLFQTLVRMKKEYKAMLQNSYRNKIIDKVNPRFMHKKYFNKLLPKHFHDGDSSNTLQSNKSQFQSYILHNNDKYIIAAIEQHKMNQKEAFCAIKYKDHNWQQFNLKQFQLQTQKKLSDDISYIQLVIKSKLQSQTFYFSQYNQNDQTILDQDGQLINQKIWGKAELEVLVVLGLIGVYDDRYIDLDTLQEMSHQLMRLSTEQYIKLMTYKIVHYLTIVSKIYVTRIKLKWIVNDAEQHYLQQVLAFQTTPKPNRTIKYFIPQIKDNQNFYKDSRYFIKIHQQLQLQKAIPPIISLFQTIHTQRNDKTTIKFVSKSLHYTKAQTIPLKLPSINLKREAKPIRRQRSLINRSKTIDVNKHYQSVHCNRPQRRYAEVNYTLKPMKKLKHQSTRDSVPQLLIDSSRHTINFIDV